MSEPVIQHLEQQLSIQSLKLNALLEITSAINSNAGVDSLLAIYAFILKEQLLHRKFVLFIKQEDWNCPVKVGYKGKITLDEHLPDLLRFKETTFLYPPPSPPPSFVILEIYTYNLTLGL